MGHPRSDSGADIKYIYKSIFSMAVFKYAKACLNTVAGNLGGGGGGQGLGPGSLFQRDFQTKYDSLQSSRLQALEQFLLSL